MPAPLFPFQPNWANPVRERLEWLTDVFESHAGHEQRIALRSMPRRWLSYQLTAQAIAAQQLDGLIWRNQSRRWLLPIWTDPQRLTADLPAGADYISAQTAGYSFTVPGWALLCHGTAHEVVELGTVGPAGLQLASETQRAWPASSLIYPAHLARLPAHVSLDRITAGLLNGPLEFELEPSSSPALPSAEQHQGQSVATWRPDWFAPVAAIYQRKIQRLDYQLGTVHIDDLAGTASAAVSHRYVLGNRNAIAAWRGWLHACSGRAQSFWQPQWQMDLQQAAPIAANSNLLPVNPLDYSSRYNQEPGRRDIALRHRDGRWFFRRILAATAGDPELLTLDSPLGIAANPGDFPIITWLLPARFDSDEHTIVWNTAGVAVTSADIRSLRA